MVTIVQNTKSGNKLHVVNNVDVGVIFVGNS